MYGRTGKKAVVGPARDLTWQDKLCSHKWCSKDDAPAVSMKHRHYGQNAGAALHAMGIRHRDCQGVQKLRPV